MQFWNCADIEIMPAGAPVDPIVPPTPRDPEDGGSGSSSNAPVRAGRCAAELPGATSALGMGRVMRTLLVGLIAVQGS